MKYCRKEEDKDKYKYKIHKYTNTANDEVPERPNMWYIFEKRIVQGYQKLYPHVPNTQIQKLKYTNIQIQCMTKCQKDPTCGIFLKEDCSRVSNIIFPYNTNLNI